MKPDDLHPKRALRWLLGIRWLRSTIEWLLVALAWYGVASSFLSIASSAEWVIAISIYIYDMVLRNVPRLVFLLDLIHAAVVYWRLLTDPLFRFIFGWVPFSVPREMLDVTVIIGVLVSGRIRAWFATSSERAFARAISPELSKEGRNAVLKRIYFATTWMDDAKQEENHDRVESMRDKAETELVSALDDLTYNARATAKDDDIVDAIMSMKGDDIRDMMEYVINLEEIERFKRRRLIRRSVAFAAGLLLIVGVDAAYALV